jgi:hypothetical protein
MHRDETTSGVALSLGFSLRDRARVELDFER